MTSTATPSAPPAEQALGRAEGVELLGDVHGSGYKEGAALVRRADGQMVQLGPLMYAVLESIDGKRSLDELAADVSEKTGREFDTASIVELARKLAAQGLLAGTEQAAPPRRNPLLALRWKVLVTNPRITRLLTAPFTVLFRPFILWPVVACFVAVFWYVLVEKGVGSATAQAFDRPGLLLLVFALAVASAGFHELGHAAACRYGGATPEGMGVGLYLVWPAFYTDVTDAYRLPRRDRLRVDLGGIYFNAVIAVATFGVWLAWRVDALLLLIALQVLMMVKNLSPVIRSDGYHILSDATGIPDLYAHIGPTLRRLLPWRRTEPSALTGRARLIVTLWVLIVVPVLVSLMLGAVILLPRLATSAWDSGRVIAGTFPGDVSHGRAVDVLASVLRLVALFLPVIGSVLIAQRLLRGGLRKADNWSAGRPIRRGAVVAAAALAASGAAWAWWPAGQYQAVGAANAGTLGGLAQLVSSPQKASRPVPNGAPAHLLAPGRHLAMAMIPVGGATPTHPALFVVQGDPSQSPVALLSDAEPAPPAVTTTAQTTTAQTTTTTTPSSSSPQPVPATAFPFQLPSKPPAGGTQAVAANSKNGGVLYKVAYALVTVSGGAPVTNQNSAFALASCKSCTTVAVSFQVVLVVGTSRVITPINAAVAANKNCPACVTTAIADQMVVTLTKQPSKQLVASLEAALSKLNALSSLGAKGTPAEIAAQVEAVEQQVTDELNGSGLLAHPIATTTDATTTTAPTTISTTTTQSTTTGTTTTQATTTNQSTTTSPAPTTSTTRTTTSQSTTTTPTTTAQTTTGTTTTSPTTTTTPTTTSAQTTTTTG